MYRTITEIDLKSLEKNISIIRKFINDDTKIISVVKGNAYGHGLVKIASKLEEIGIDFFAVENIDEGIKLRNGGIESEILILSETSLIKTSSLQKYNLTQSIGSFKYGKELNSLSDEGLKVHLKIDSGMSRLGFKNDNKSLSNDIYKLIKTCNNLKFLGIYTHFADADNEKRTRTEFIQFSNLIEMLNKKCPFKIKHCANSKITTLYQICIWTL